MRDNRIEPKTISSHPRKKGDFYRKNKRKDELQKVVCQLFRRLLWSRTFEAERIRGKYWQVIMDGTQLFRSRKELDKHSLFSVHKKGTEDEYTEYYYYLLEAKIVLNEKIHVSIMTEFVENEGGKSKSRTARERQPDG